MALRAGVYQGLSVCDVRINLFQIINEHHTAATMNDNAHQYREAKSYHSKFHNQHECPRNKLVLIVGMPFDRRRHGLLIAGRLIGLLIYYISKLLDMLSAAAAAAAAVESAAIASNASLCNATN